MTSQNSPLVSATTIAIALSLSACGGGEWSSETAAKRDVSEVAYTGDNREQDTPAQMEASFEYGASLNTAELLNAEAISANSDPVITRVDAKSFLQRIAAYRFYNTGTGAHFYTVNVSERNQVIATLPHFRYEGLAFYANAVAAPGLSPVFRFYNQQTGVHFYTISQAERRHIQATMNRPGF